jgi:crotonobetainyl-CoA:carnitine CoA-transferase CaiB-like acyl-CoA transferase
VTAPSYDHPPPLLGQHSDQILQELLGLEQDDLTALRDGGVI